MTDRAIKITPPDEEKRLYTEGIDYSKTGNASIWGTEDRLTQKALDRLDFRGRWLNLCAGDGRFNDKLLRKAAEVVAVDADLGALEKLVKITPNDLKDKLATINCNVTERLPFDDASFDGIFCTGTLHLFPKEVFKKIFTELNRITKPGGTMIIDFSADIKRVRSDGSLYTVAGEPLYTLNEAEDFLRTMFADFQINLQTDVSEPESVSVRGETYIFSCKYILLIATKPN